MCKSNRHLVNLTSLLLILLLPACGQQTLIQNTEPLGSSSSSTWQEQYDLGMRYLSEGNYAEAIIAFTGAIEIDPKQAQAYVGRGQARIFSGETEENLLLAQTDFEAAIELDSTCVEAYLGLADVFVCRKDYDRGIEILKQGMNKTNDNPWLSEKIEQIEKSKGNDTVELTEEESHILSDIMAHLESRDYKYLHYTYNDSAYVRTMQFLCKKASGFNYDGEKLVKEYHGIGLRILPAMGRTFYYGEIDIEANGNGVAMSGFGDNGVPALIEKDLEYYVTVEGVWESDWPNGLCTYTKYGYNIADEQCVDVHSGMFTNVIFDGEIKSSYYISGELSYRYSCSYNMGHQVLDERWKQINNGEWVLPFEEGTGLGMSYQPDFVFEMEYSHGN